MVEKKYNKVLTVVIVIAVVAAIGVLGYWGYDTYRKYYERSEANEALSQFDNVIIRQRNTTNETQRVELDANMVFENEVGGGTNTNPTYKGFAMSGKIEIPKIKLNYPVLARATEASLEVGVGISYGPGLNQVGNTVIYGHNYKDKTFFSDLDELSNGDAIYITDNSGNRQRYKIYNIYTTSPSDLEYANRDTAGKKEITLSTCTDDVQARLIIWAVEDE